MDSDDRILIQMMVQEYVDSDNNVVDGTYQNLEVRTLCEKL